MPKFAIVATLDIAPGRIEEYLPVAMAHRARCLRDEPGTLQFEVLRVQADDTKVMLYEVYRDQAAFDAHWNVKRSPMKLPLSVDLIRIDP